LADNSVFRNNLIEYYHQQSDSQLQKIKSGAVDSKLIFFSNIFIPNFFPFCLEISQLGISAHCLDIERGRYNKPKRTERFCDLNHKTGKKFSLYLYMYGMISKNVLLSLLQDRICRIVLLF
jgi:hypothetical protein